MGTYREQLLKETYGKSGEKLYVHPRRPGMEEEMSSPFTMFRLKFLAALCLFGVFAWMSLTGKSVAGVTAEQIGQAVTSQEFPAELSDFSAWLEEGLSGD